MMTTQLPEDVHGAIKLLCKQGDDLAKLGEIEPAKRKYVSALKLVPDNHSEWEAATWIYVAIGDLHLRTGDFEKAFRCFFNAVQSPGGLGNPYVHLRLGQLYFEQDSLDKAADELTRAYMGAGVDIFMEDDPKYLDFLETRIHI
jgi:tetratricopeptide (TPR) repeat protein